MPDRDQEAAVFRRQIEFPVDIDRLWELLTDPTSVATWFGSDVEWELAPGGEIRFADGEEGVRTGRVESVDPPHQLRFQWWPEDSDTEISEVTYHLASVEDGTELTITEEPMRNGRIPAMDSAVESTSPTTASAGANVLSSNVGGGYEPAVWSTWDSRLAGVWCAATAPALLVTA
jgi:uncharacterized protein YndB with AHSA1/START domain